MAINIKGNFINLSDKTPEKRPKSEPEQKIQSKNEELALKHEFLEVNGKKKNWTKSDYYKDMLIKD